MIDKIQHFIKVTYKNKRSRGGCQKIIKVKNNIQSEYILKTAHPFTKIYIQIHCINYFLEMVNTNGVKNFKKKAKSETTYLFLSAFTNGATNRITHCRGNLSSISCCFFVFDRCPPPFATV